MSLGKIGSKHKFKITYTMYNTKTNTSRKSATFYFQVKFSIT